MRADAIARLVRLLETRRPEVDEEERLRVAAGALLVECARMDASYSDAERAAVAAAMVQLFALEPDVADPLVAIAEKRADEVWHDWILTEAVRRGFDAEEREILVHKLWKVALASGGITHREEAFVHRIGRELGISAADVDRVRSSAEGGA